MVRSWLLISTFLAMSAAAPALGELRLEVDPPDPLATTPVTVTVADEFANTCFQVCDVAGFWVEPTEYHINWYIEQSSDGCVPVIVTLSSEVALGTLEPADYLVTASEHVAEPRERCHLGSLSGESYTTFHVSGGPTVPTVSVWGFIAMTVLVLAVGTVLLHRRMAGASATGG